MVADARPPIVDTPCRCVVFAEGNEFHTELRDREGNAIISMIHVDAEPETRTWIKQQWHYVATALNACEGVPSEHMEGVQFWPLILKQNQQLGVYGHMIEKAVRGLQAAGQALDGAKQALEGQETEFDAEAAQMAIVGLFKLHEDIANTMMSFNPDRQASTPAPGGDKADDAPAIPPPQ